MGDVIQFRSKIDIGEADVRKTLHGILTGKWGHSASVAEEVCAAVMPAIVESRNTIATGVSFSAPSSLTEEQISEVSSSLSKPLQEYQMKVAENSLKLAMLLAVEMADRISGRKV